MSAAALPPAAQRRRAIVTPEGLALGLTLASRGARAGALILDVMIILFGLIAFHIALIAVAGGLLEGVGEGVSAAPTGAGEFLQIMLIIALFLGWYGYFLVQELGPCGATLGKRIMGIRIAARSGERLTPEAVIARNLLRDIEIFYPLVFILVTAVLAASGEASGTMIWVAAAWFALFALLPFFNRDALRAGDIIAGTWVVEAPRIRLAEALSLAANSSAARDTASEPPAAAHRFTPNELGIYGIRELQVLERMLREADPPALVTVHATICRKLSREADAEEARPFLEAFYAALRDKLEKDMRFGKRKADKFS
jgi:uncharacterized RDD family membrane protein YckC